MAWTELIEARTPVTKTWADGQKRHFVHLGKTVAHYDGGEVDLTPERVVAGDVDGWSVTKNGWHYFLGKPPGKVTDGWVGFGGRGGEHWALTRLVRLGYLHWPTRAWQDVGGAPNYDRANLTRETEGLAVGPEGSQSVIPALTKAVWGKLWETPGGGEARAEWYAEGRGLKEHIVINQAARTWVAANRPPTTPVSETYFGMVFQADLSDIPKVVKGGIVQDLEGDFDDDDGTATLEMRDAADELLAFLPISQAWSSGDEQTRIGLRKRIWKDGDGNVYLLVGAKVADLVGLPAGDVVFDPTYETPQDQSLVIDAYVRSATATTNYGSSVLMITDLNLLNGLMEFDLSAIPSGSTCDSATLSIWSLVGAGGGPVTVTINTIKAANDGWTEGGSTWNTKDGSNSWAGGNSGCNTASDINTTPIGSNTVPATANTRVDFTLTAATVGTWFGSPNTNYGFAFRQASTDTTAFNSSEATTAGYRPMISVDYTSPPKHFVHKSHTANPGYFMKVV